MFRKLTIALVATAALGTAALSSSAAEAHWRGYGWSGYGHGYGYGHSYWKPHYGYGYGHYGYKPRLLRLLALLPPALRLEGRPRLLLGPRRGLTAAHDNDDPGVRRGAGIGGAHAHFLIGPRCGVWEPIFTNVSST